MRRIANNQIITILSFREVACTLFIATYLLLSGNGFSQPNDCSHVHLPDHLAVNKSKSVLLLVADDRSGSTNGTNQPARITEQQYHSLLQTFVDNGYTGQFAIRIIGNTPHSGFEEALTFQPVFQLEKIPENATLSERAKYNCENVRIKEMNQLVSNSNKQKVDDYMTRIIRPKAINYHPNGVDKTDIFSALRDIEMKMNVGGAFNKIIIIVFSDGVDSNKKELRMRLQVPADLLLIGWASNTPVKDEKEIHLQSADDMVTWFQTLKF
jgi:hypothetical protein